MNPHPSSNVDLSLEEASVTIISSTARPMVHNDLAAAHELSQAVGWGHRFEDWELLLNVGKGVVAVSPDGALSGVAMWWPYGSDYAAIGMVIVSPSHQRMGIGKLLMDAILVEASGRRLFLNATDEGSRLYESLGFTATGTISTHYGELASDRPPIVEGTEVRDLRREDWREVLRIDHEASGMDRTPLLTALEGVSGGLVARSEGRLTGFILPRRFQRGTLLGPVVADTEHTAIALISATAARADGLLRTDIPTDAVTLGHWLEQVGLVRVGQVTTMWSPAAPEHGSTARVYGLAAQALG